MTSPPTAWDVSRSIRRITRRFGSERVKTTAAGTSASETEFAFLRRLVSDNLIPDDVTIQVLVQCREHLIRRTFESLQGVKRAIVHIYNSTNPLQRRVVFGASKEEIRKLFPFFAE